MLLEVGGDEEIYATTMSADGKIIAASIYKQKSTEQRIVIINVLSEHGVNNTNTNINPN